MGQLSTNITVCMSIDRALAVVKPFKWKILCSRSRVRASVVAAFILSVVFQIPEMVANEGAIMLKHSTARVSWVDVFKSYVSPVFKSALPMSTIIISNVTILTKLKRGGSHSTKQTDDLPRASTA